jgi:hypothetical protein
MTPGNLILTICLAVLLIGGGTLAIAAPLTTLAGIAGLIDCVVMSIGLVFHIRKLIKAN